jgi:uncharacterized protein (DUF2252 family)
MGSSSEEGKKGSMSASVTKPSQRPSVLHLRQRMKMSESAHAFVRGNTIKFYEWLNSKSVQASLPTGPDIWICGDCHTGNLGPVADIKGRIDIQIRDLDQTVIGNPSHDVLRLGLSLAMAARSSDLPGVTTALMMEELVLGYISGLRGKFDKLEPANLEPISRVMREAKHRQWRHLAEERIENIKPTIPLGRKFWSLSRQENAELKAMFESGGLNALVSTVSGEKNEKVIRLVDAAYWMKGCSSLGQLRYAALVTAGAKKKAKYRLLDIKEATVAAAPRSKNVKMPTNNAERVVAGAKALSPYLGERMLSAMIGKRSVVVRELRPQDLKFELDGLKQSEAITIAHLMAGVVGRAHGRQMPESDRQAWVKELRSRHTKGLDAPRWLWTGVLDLAALHEGAYLEHCRQFALGK